MGICRICGAKACTISNVIGVCIQCLRKYPDKAVAIAMESHRRYRRALGLPEEPPQSTSGVKCFLCVNECSIPCGGRGYCGVWINDGGKLRPEPSFGEAIAYYYLDPLPTNCVATPVCPAATGAGYPRYAYRPGPEYGYYNLAVFFAGCNLDCLFCQNWEHKEMLFRKSIFHRYVVDVDTLVRVAMRDDVACICYFGGDPGPYAPFAISTSRKIAERARNAKVIKRICWETNGLENPKIMEEMARLSFESGGIVKIDFKAWTPSVYQALTGIDGTKAVERVKKNIELVARMSRERDEIPLLVVSTLLVPGYVDVEEVAAIAKFLASIDSSIPYVLLAFHPDHLLKDLPPTSRRHAEEAYRAAKEAGLERVFIENVWLLGDYY